MRVGQARVGAARAYDWTGRTALPFLTLLMVHLGERLAANTRSAAGYGAGLARTGWRRTRLETELPLYAAAVLAAVAVGVIVAHSI